MRYRIFDFDIESEITLPCDVRLCSHPSLEAATAHLEVVFRPRPDWIFQRVVPIGRRVWGCAYDTGDGVMVCLQTGVLMHFRRDGKRVEVHFDQQCPVQTAHVGTWLVNIGISICLLLRGDIPFHGASVEWNDRLFCVMAEARTGKTTLLWRLLDAGALFYGDDLLPIHIGEEGLLASPSISLSSQLSSEALIKRGFAPADFEETIPGADRFWVPIDAPQRTFKKRSPAALFILSPFAAPDGGLQSAPIFVRRHVGADAVSLLLANTHGLWATCEVLDSKALMSQYLRLAREVPIFTLHYARDFSVLPRVREALSHIISKEL